MPTRIGNSAYGVKRFRKVGKSVLKKLMQLREHKKAVKESIIELTDHANNLTSVLKRLDKNIQKMERRRKFLHTSGVAATTLGSTLAAALWAIAYVNEEEEDGYCTPLAWLATGVGIGGTVVKLGTAYTCSRSNQAHMKELEESMSSHHGKDLSKAEKDLHSKFKEMIQLLKELYGDGEDLNKDGSEDSSQHPLLHHRATATEGRQGTTTSNDPAEAEGAPLVITLMETADTASCAPDVLSTVFEYTTDLGLESMEVIGQTYDAATASLGEVISFGILEGATNGLAVVLSSYEIYKLIGSWNKENPTSQKVEELVTNVQKKFKVYNNLKKCIEIVDTFLSLRTNSLKR